MAEYAVLILKAVRDLIEELGMSAKRTSGFGIGKDLKVTLLSGNGFQFPKDERPISVVIKEMEGDK